MWKSVYRFKRGKHATRTTRMESCTDRSQWLDTAAIWEAEKQLTTTQQLSTSIKVFYVTLSKNVVYLVYLESLEQRSTSRFAIHSRNKQHDLLFICRPLLT